MEYLVVLLLSIFLLVLLGAALLFFWKRTKAEKDTDRAKVLVEFAKTAIQAIAAIALIIPVVPALRNLQQQSAQSVAAQSERTQQENNAQFALAIESLRATDLPSTEGALVILERLRKSDGERFREPVQRVLRATLLDLQNASKDEILDFNRTTEASRYLRVLEAYIGAYGDAYAANSDVDDAHAPEQVDLEFLRARRLSLPSLQGQPASLRASMLVESSLWGVEAPGSAFDNADLSGTTFVRANLQRASFKRAQLFNASFSGANLEYADFTGASMHRARLAGAQLHCADLRGADLRDAEVDLETLLPAYVAPETALPDVISYDEIVKERGRRGLTLNCNQPPGAHQ